jgi:hypothetical protein
VGAMLFVVGDLSAYAIGAEAKSVDVHQLATTSIV